MSLAIRLLRELSDHLERLAGDFRQKAESARKEERDIFQDIHLLCNYMQDERKGLFVHRRSLEALVGKACDEVADMFRAKMQAKVFVSAEQVCSALQAYIGTETYRKLPDGTQMVERAGLIHSVATLRQQLGRLQVEIDRNLASFEKTSEHMIFENLYRPGMFREYYRLQPLGKQAEWKEVNLRGNEDQLLEEECNFRYFAKITNLYDLLEQFEVLGPLNIERIFVRYAETRFRDLDVRADALKMFYEKYEKEKRVEERIARLVYNASPWIVPSRLASCANVVRDNCEEAVELGLSPNSTGHLPYEDFLKKLSNNITVCLYKSKLGLPVALEPDSIVLYTEMAGFPLLFVDRLEEYEEAYRLQLRNKAALHITRFAERFADILTRNEEQIETIIRINEVLLLGTILHTFEMMQRRDGEVEYAFKNDKTVPPRSIPLGRYSMVVDMLRNDPETLDLLSDKINQLRENLTLTSRQQFYTVLVSQIEDGTNILPDRKDGRIPAGPFPPRFSQVGNVRIDHRSLEYGILERVKSQEQERLIQLMISDPEQVKKIPHILYPELTEFSELVETGKVTMRRLKNPQTSAVPLASPQLGLGRNYVRARQFCRLTTAVLKHGHGEVADEH
jgi:hypothetical protein